MPRTTKTLIPELIAFTLFFGLIFSFHKAGAQSTADVTATVTVQNISVSVSDGTVAYGTLGTSSTEDTTTNGINDSQTATNTGNVTVNLNIRGTNSAAWTLGGTQAENQYFHKFCTTNCDSSPSWTALTTNNQNLAASVASSGSQIFDLQVGTPTITSSYDQQSVNVTVQAAL